MKTGNLKDWNPNELIDEYNSYLELIDVIGCYGTKDLRMRDALENELLRRGFQLTGKKTKWNLIIK